MLVHKIQVPRMAADHLAYVHAVRVLGDVLPRLAINDAEGAACGWANGNGLEAKIGRAIGPFHSGGPKRGRLPLEGKRDVRRCFGRSDERCKCNKLGNWKL